MRSAKVRIVGLAFLLAACGSTTQERAATGGLTGVGIGALAGGPVGAAIGGVAGGVAGWVTPEGADTLAQSAIHETKQATIGGGPRKQANGSAAPRSGSTTKPNRLRTIPVDQPSNLQIAPDLAKHLQTVLSDQGLYDGPVDGIVGRRTRAALAEYQEREGLAHSPVLDLQTLQSLTAPGKASSGSQGGAAPISNESRDPGAAKDIAKDIARMRDAPSEGETRLEHQ